MRACLDQTATHLVNRPAGGIPMMRGTFGISKGAARVLLSFIRYYGDRYGIPFYWFGECRLCSNV